MCDIASLQKENASLKAQLKKGLVSCIQGKEKLDELLGNQKESFQKEGLGYSPKFKKSNARHGQQKPKTTFVPSGHKANVEKKKEVVGNVAKKSHMTHDKFISMDPSFVLRKGKDGNVFAQYVGDWSYYVPWTIWVPKVLVTNVRGPIQKWVLKSKA
jgi:hypothetical protein